MLNGCGKQRRGEYSIMKACGVYSSMKDISYSGTKTPEPYYLKPSNPKDALGIMKVPFSTIPAPVMAEVGIAMYEGARKYGRHNYRSIGVRASVYYDAVFRHMISWWEGEDTDPDSGLHHVIKAITSLVVIRDAMIQNKFVDDRPPKSPSCWLPGMNNRIKEIAVKYPDAKEPYTEVNKNTVR